MTEALQHSIDLDSHEMVPPYLWGETFGRNAEKLYTLIKPWVDHGLGVTRDKEAAPVEGPPTDTAPINDATVWGMRGERAPGAFDFSRRLEVMDRMGIDRQLIFPQFGYFAHRAATLEAGKGAAFVKGLEGRADLAEVKRIGREAVGEYNDWAVNIGRMAPDRLRPAAPVFGEGSVQDLVAETDDLLKRGIRAILISQTLPPAGLSPAHPDLDPFWSLLEEANVPVVTHIGQSGFLRLEDVWRDAPAFGFDLMSDVIEEVGGEPYGMSTLHYPFMNYISVMVLGGVFERHPSLRFGAIECGGSWLAGLAENLDNWAQVFHRRLSGTISMKPSEYLARHVRVTPFFFEPVDKYLQQNLDLQDCYCYSSDYPHYEGGKYSKRTATEKLAPLGEAVMEKYFSRNGELLLPA